MTVSLAFFFLNFLLYIQLGRDYYQIEHFHNAMA